MNTFVKSAMINAINSPGSYFKVQGFQELKLFNKIVVNVENPIFVYDHGEFKFFGSQYSRGGLVTDVSGFIDETSKMKT